MQSNKRVKMVPALKAFWVNSEDYLRETFKESKSSLPPFLSFFVVYNLPNANCLSYDTRHKHSYVHKKKIVYSRKTPHITSPLPSPPAFLLSWMNSPTKCRTTSLRDSLFLPQIISQSHCFLSHNTDGIATWTNAARVER